MPKSAVHYGSSLWTGHKARHVKVNYQKDLLKRSVLTHWGQVTPHGDRELSQP